MKNQINQHVQTINQLSVAEASFIYERQHHQAQERESLEREKSLHGELLKLHQNSKSLEEENQQMKHQLQEQGQSISHLSEIESALVYAEQYIKQQELDLD